MSTAPDSAPAASQAHAAEPEQRQRDQKPVHEHRHPWRVEGARREPDKPNATGVVRRPPGGKFIWLVLLGMFAANWLIASQVQPSGHPRLTVPYSYFRAQAQTGNVAEVSSTGAAIQGSFRHVVTYPAGKKGQVTHLFTTQRPAFADDQLLSLLLSNKVTVNANPVNQGRSLLSSLLLGFGPTLLLVGLFVLMMRRASSSMGSGGMLGKLGKSKAKRYDASTLRTTFADVAGIDEATDELAEIVGFLKEPDRYRRLGGMIPKGVLLTGPPGTGKTLLARAVAGEADVPFFSLSASEFVEMIVGVGASRVRDLFEQAKTDAPAIIFIDELDAIGRARGGGAMGGANDEREQTLNQILTEMDGFTGSEGVIVVAATNRPEILDPALLRPGRFDRRVTVNPPDHAGRRKILEVHTRNVPLGDDVDLGALAGSTPGMVGADLRNLVNEAALGAARRGHELVKREDFTDAFEKIVLGTARRIVLSEEDRRRTAYHESGHALLGMLEPGADPVRKVSIIPRGRALGVTFQSPDADRYGYTQSYLRGRIVGALGGQAAEELIYGEITTGAESDLEQATAVARQMVGRWGMSEKLGRVSVLPGPGEQSLLFPGMDGATSERTRELIDDEVKRITDECYARAVEALSGHRDQLDRLAAALLASETLDEPDAYQAAGIPQPAHPDQEPPAQLIAETPVTGTAPVALVPRGGGDNDRR
ncbi:MAG: ATP-dependent zinc metalloprotease FtsH [Actinomycetota bacterium]|nr:ATP-dependent zinc metalloprotease FtsH [Actinomycetota bacterium]